MADTAKTPPKPKKIPHGHTEGHGDDHHKLAVGIPGTADEATRTIEVSMIETDDGDMIFNPAVVDVALGETIRFAITNTGELEHEFVLDTIAKNAEHKALMEQFRRWSTTIRILFALM